MSANPGTSEPRRPGTDRRRAFVAAFLGWMLDGYDFTLLALVLIDIEREFKISHTAAGALGTITLLLRLVGGILAGLAADRWGRKLPMMVSILWFSIFAFLSGLSPTYGTLLLCRALFGVGMGGEWAAGMPLVLEHYPERRRGLILGLLQGAFSWGYILAAAAFQFGTPYLEGYATSSWRILMWTGILPALLVLWIRRGVKESPLWLSGQIQSSRRPRVRARSMLQRRVIISAGALASMMFAYYSMQFWYATLLRERGLAPLAFLIALNIGGIAGAASWGRLADTRLGHRRAIALGAAVALVTVPAFLLSTSPVALWIGALVIGFTGAGIIGVAPSFIGAQFEITTRATGWGIVYHLGAAAGALPPLLIGELMDAGWNLPIAMASCIAGACLMTIALVASVGKPRAA